MEISCLTNDNVWGCEGCEGNESISNAAFRDLQAINGIFMFPPALSYYTLRILPEGEQLIYTHTYN